MCGREPIATTRFRTNVDDVVIAGKAHPIWVNEDPLSGAPSPYIEFEMAFGL